MEMIKLHLLILEDNPDDAELSVKELERKGFNVKWTRVDTDEAFRKALAAKPDLILVDYSLPSFDALAALEIHRQLDLEIPLIIVSGTIGEKVAVECMKSGATDYVLKDNLSRLGPVVKRALEEAAAHREKKRMYERIQHLNSVLKAIRHINQLVVVEKNRDSLLRKACDILIEARGYDGAWLGFLKDDKTFATVVGSGLREDISRFSEHVIAGDHPLCIENALNHKYRVVIVDKSGECGDCFYKNACIGKEAAIMRVENNGKLYGLLAILFATDVPVDDEETELLKEVAGDIALGLHNMELEEIHKQADKALLESEEKYRTLYNFSRDAIMILTPDKGFLSGNPACVKMFGCRNEGEFISLTPAALSPEYQPDGVLSVEKAQKMISIAMEQGSHFFEWKHKRVNREEFDAAVLLTRMKLYGEKILQATVRDITERKKLEAQFRQSQKMEAIGTLAGGIAHDFNNLLTVIIGNAQLALMNVIKDESLRKGIEETKKAGERAASLTQQLLAFSRKQIIKPEVMDLNKEVNETKKMLKRMIGEDIEFETVLEPELWKVYADSGQINQVIINMVVNAKDAMFTCADSAAGRPQGGKLTIETANADLNENYFCERGVEGEKPGHYVMLVVSDTGIGMDKETREHIFEPFFTTKEVGKGTGLGLSTIYGIVKQNNGFIWVYSEPGKGTTFKVYLPRVKEDTEPEEKEQTSVAELGGSETVLIVEDDDSLRNLAQKALQSYGYRVLVAENGEDALRICKEHEGPIHLMITDVVMPKMGGREAADLLQPLYPQIKVIYMSGYTDNAIVRHGVLKPGLNFLEKPFTPEDLARKVREALEE